MTRQQNVDALKGAIRDYVRALIASEQGQIGIHQGAALADQRLGDALRAAFGLKTEERATND